MRKRVEAMLEALATLRPPLDQFYGLLTDEQKARFNAIGAQPVRAARDHSLDRAQFCSVESVEADVPIKSIQQALHLNEAQNTALDALKDATAKGAEILKGHLS
jgi:hypothetical protein